MPSKKASGIWQGSQTHKKKRKKPLGLSPTQRTLKRLRREGWFCAIVEHWNHFAGIRQDLFGCLDILALRPGSILGVQATSASNHAARMTKSMALPNLRHWLEAGGDFEVWSWGLKGKRGQSKSWKLRRTRIAKEDLPHA